MSEGIMTDGRLITAEASLLVINRTSACRSKSTTLFEFYKFVLEFPIQVHGAPLLLDNRCRSINYTNLSVVTDEQLNPTISPFF